MEHTQRPPAVVALDTLERALYRLPCVWAFLLWELPRGAIFFEWDMRYWRSTPCAKWRDPTGAFMCDPTLHFIIVFPHSLHPIRFAVHAATALIRLSTFSIGMINRVGTYGNVKCWDIAFHVQWNVDVVEYVY